MITESFHEYKNYIIKLRACTYNGFGFSILKQVENKNSPNGFKNITLKEKRYNFTSSEKLLKESKEYIDNYSIELEVKLEKKWNNLQGLLS